MTLLIRSLLLLSVLTALVGCGQSQTEETGQAAATAEDTPTPETAVIDTPVVMPEKKVREMTWIELVPPEGQVDSLLEQVDIENLSDDDPRAKELVQQWLENAPVIEELDGERIKISGFVVPLELDTNAIREFLLVPYFGACVHVPPPPPNQVIYVKSPLDQPYQGAQFDTVWITGTLSVEDTISEMGDAGYTIQASAIEPYTDGVER